MNSYKAPRAIIAILLKITIGFAALLCLAIVGFFIFAIAIGGREMLSLLPQAILMTGLIILYAGVTYVLLHGILAVFDIADNAAVRTAERTSERAVAKSKPLINHDERTPVAHPVILDDSYIPRSR